MRISFLLFIGVFFYLNANAQGPGKLIVDSLEREYYNWFNMDPVIDKVSGASVDKAWDELLANKTPKAKIIVAVIDGGVDTAHVELQGKIWTNPKEIAGNGKDDDNNGYIDDIHGWNFLGNAKGENIQYETLEQVREFKKLDPLYNWYLKASDVPADQQEVYRHYIACKTKYQKELKEYQNLNKEYEKIIKNYTQAEKTLKEFLKSDTIQIDALININTIRQDVKWAQQYYVTCLLTGRTPEGLAEFKKQIDTQLNYNLNIDYNPRAIINDNVLDINDRSYGNNNVKGPNPDHGTFCAGIIAGNRSNNIGIKGIAENVEIMSLRVVPDGDERDKDIALAIRYAVDHGARVINMSFGKSFSPQKQFIDEAVQYAASKNVLLVHAAGNDAMNTDTVQFFPKDLLLDQTTADNWIDVGACTKKMDKDLCATFSNFGKLNVDVFAPGKDVMSICPENRYNTSDGTSFAAPVVSGVAALVLTYYPELTAAQLKQVLLSSVTPLPKKKVYIPSESEKRKKTKFKNLCVTGGIINAYKALQAAELIVK